MVDFSSPINNADMVKGLNKLVSLNANILSSLKDLPDSLDDEEARHQVEGLRAMHERHISSISDSIRALGGSADGSDWHRFVTQSKLALGKVGNAMGALRALRSEEQKLQEEYARKLDELSPSPEAVEAIRQARDENATSIDALASTLERKRH